MSHLTESDLALRALQADRAERAAHELAMRLHTTPLPIVPVRLDGFNLALGAGVALVIGVRDGAIAADGQVVQMPVPVLAIELTMPVLENLHNALGDALQRLRTGGEKPPAPRLVT